MLQWSVDSEEVESVDASGHQNVDFVSDEFFGENYLVAVLRSALLGRFPVGTGRRINHDAAVPVLYSWPQDDAGIVEIESLDSKG